VKKLMPVTVWRLARCSENLESFLRTEN